jgi:hypothetical protein
MPATARFMLGGWVKVASMQVASPDPILLQQLEMGKPSAPRSLDTHHPIQNIH